MASPLDALANLLGSLDKPLKVFSDQLEKTISPGQKVVDLLGKVASALSDLLSHLGAAQTVKPEQQNTQVKEAGAGAAAALGGLVAGISAATSAITGAISSVQGFVQALSPIQIELFQRALRDLQATVGVAFQPIFEVLTGTIRQVAGIILPLMVQLRPVIQQVTEVFSTSLLQSAKSLVGILTALLPVIQLVTSLFEVLEAATRPFVQLTALLIQLLVVPFQLLAAVLQPFTELLKVVQAAFDGMTDVIEVVTIIIRALALTIQQAIQGLGGFDIKGLVSQIAAAFKTLITTILVFVASLAKVLGFDGFVKNLIDILSPKGEGAKAADTVGIKGFEQIAKDLALASAVATPAGEGGKEAGLNDVVGVLQKIQDGTTPLTEIRDFVKKIIDFINDLPKPGTLASRAANATGFGGPQTLRDNSLTRSATAWGNLVSNAVK